MGRTRLEGILQEFAECGLLERRPRKGIFRTGTFRDAKIAPFIDLVACCELDDGSGSRSLFFGQLIEEFMAQVGKTSRGVRLHRFTRDTPLRDYRELLFRSDIRACVLLRLGSVDIPGLFDEANVAWVSLFPRTTDCLRQTILSSPEMMTLQLNHLFELGHRRIGYLDSSGPYNAPWIYCALRKTFYRMMAESGICVNPRWVGYTEGWDREAHRVLKNAFSEPPYPTALIGNDAQLPAIYQFCEERELVIGKDISVIGTNDLPIAAAMQPPATTVRNCRKQATQIALQTLEQVQIGQSIPDRQFVPVELVVRESTGPASMST